MLSKTRLRDQKSIIETSIDCNKSNIEIKNLNGLTLSTRVQNLKSSVIPLEISPNTNLNESKTNSSSIDSCRRNLPSFNFQNRISMYFERIFKR